MTTQNPSAPSKLRDAAETIYLRWLVARAFRPPHVGRVRALLRTAAALGGAALAPAVPIVCILVAVILGLAGWSLDRL